MFHSVVGITQGTFESHTDDSDVKMLSTVNGRTQKLSYEVDLHWQNHIFMHKKRYMQKELKHEDDDDLLQQVRSLVKAYVLLGCDSNAGFHNISHAYGIKIFIESSKTMLFSTEEDFLLLLLTIYESRNAGLKRFFEMEETNVNIEEKLLRTRYFIKTLKGCEKDTIPLPSVLKLHKI